MTTPPLYKIANWANLYEVRESHRTAGPMKWIPVVTKTDGFGFGLLRQQKNNAELLAAWYLLLGVAAKQEKETRGQIARDGIALTAEDLGLMTGFPARIFDAAFAFFSNPKQGWLVMEPCAGNRAACAESAQLARNLAASSAEMPPHNRTLQDKTLQDMTVEQNAAGAAPAIVSPQPQPQPATPPAPASEADWLASLAASPAYRGLDVAREQAKCAVWCENKKKKMSRARLINWLNRAEIPMAGRATMR
jgi:hypothetical protein